MNWLEVALITADKLFKANISSNQNEKNMDSNLAGTYEATSEIRKAAASACFNEYLLKRVSAQRSYLHKMMYNPSIANLSN